jgi:DNA replication protein DnaC
MAIPRSKPFREASCPLGACDGSGWILGPEDVARECRCRSQRLQRNRVRGVASVIPPRYRGTSFDRPPVSDMARDPGTREALAAVHAYVDELEANVAAGRGLWLTGGTGTGKTTLAMLVSKVALDRGRTVAIYSLPKLLARIRRTYEAEPGGDSYLSFFERLTSVDLLHLDDLGVEKRSDWVLEQLYAIVNERYEAERAIVVTTNLAEPELLEQIGERTVSRLLEMCGEPRVLFGEDHRSRYDEAREGRQGTVRHLT